MRDVAGQRGGEHDLPGAVLRHEGVLKEALAAHDERFRPPIRPPRASVLISTLSDIATMAPDSATIDSPPRSAILAIAYDGRYRISNSMRPP